MKTTTTEPDSSELVDAAATTTEPDESLDPDFPIENTGGPSDAGGGTHTGSVPPPAQAY